MEIKNERRLLHILRKNIDFINELNLDPIGIGYPLVEIPDLKKKRINTYPNYKLESSPHFNDQDDYDN